ncbi:hypothetical protein PROSTU_02720 [Providencia stuartii ATCC 25827]|uniref:Uncharacterized protein n=1 Tax=Providencia stuartii ATCC 25827 TaxID=471874 RepID=A0AA86YSM2_PROST|nr:hypothetical protein PROSTU_02720 [Providencia stuartii ATCC 25827]
MLKSKYTSINYYLLIIAIYQHSKPSSYCFAVSHINQHLSQISAFLRRLLKGDQIIIKIRWRESLSVVNDKNLVGSQKMMNNRNEKGDRN